MYIANKKINEVKSIDLGNTEGLYINELYQNIEGYGPPPVELDNYISWSATSGVIREKTIPEKKGPGESIVLRLI